MAKKAYLSAIVDLHDKTIVSCVPGHSNNNLLVFQTLQLALEAAPNAKPLLHSDRGFQYTSLQFRKCWTQRGLCKACHEWGDA